LTLIRGSRSGAAAFETVPLGREDRAGQTAAEPGADRFIPEEADALAGLGEVNRELVRELSRRCPDQRIATVDQDATSAWRRCAQCNIPGIR
jgi:hypothetical protein